MQFLIFILVALSIPAVIFIPARKIVEWLLGLFLLCIIFLYYANPILQFFRDYFSLNPSTNPPSLFLHNYQLFILDHLPQWGGISLFGVNFLGMKVDHAFTTTWWPVIVLYIGGIIRFVAWFVPHNRLRKITQGYWLYITSFVILLLIASSIFAWNFLSVLFVFLLILAILATGLFRIIGDLLSLLYFIVVHIFKWIVIGMQYIALTAVKIAKFLNNVFKYIKELYKKYIQGPFQRLHEKIESIENKTIEDVTQRLNKERLDEEQDYEEESTETPADLIDRLEELKAKGPADEKPAASAET